GRVRRVLDSAPLEDAVTTQDTVTMLRGAIRGLRGACPPPLAAKFRGLLRWEDDYTAPGKPACDWTDRAAREQLVDALVRDAYRAHFALRGARLDPRGAEGPGCWPPSLAKTSRKPQMAASGSLRGLHPTGSSPPSIPRPAMGTRPPPTASTATRPMWRSTRTAKSSARPRSAGRPPATPWSRPR